MTMIVNKENIDELKEIATTVPVTCSNCVKFSFFKISPVVGCNEGVEGVIDGSTDGTEGTTDGSTVGNDGTAVGVTVGAPTDNDKQRKDARSTTTTAH